METAKIFTSGRSQAVRIPKEYRFGTEIHEVYVNKVGDALILTPMERIQEVYTHGLAGFTDDFMADGRPEQASTERPEMF